MAGFQGKEKILPSYRRRTEKADIDARRGKAGVVCGDGEIAGGDELRARRLVDETFFLFGSNG
jgi:hypothetical protein